MATRNHLCHRGMQVRCYRCASRAGTSNLTDLSAVMGGWGFPAFWERLYGRQEKVCLWLRWLISLPCPCISPAFCHTAQSFHFFPLAFYNLSFSVPTLWVFLGTLDLNKHYLLQAPLLMLATALGLHQPFHCVFDKSLLKQNPWLGMRFSGVWRLWVWSTALQTNK